MVHWPSKLKFVGDSQPKATMWFNKNKEKNDGEAEDACWEYFQEVQRRFARQRFHGEDAGLPDGFGPESTTETHRTRSTSTGPLVTTAFEWCGARLGMLPTPATR